MKLHVNPQFSSYNLQDEGVGAVRFILQLNARQGFSATQKKKAETTPFAQYHSNLTRAHFGGTSAWYNKDFENFSKGDYESLGAEDRNYAFEALADMIRVLRIAKDKFNMSEHEYNEADGLIRAALRKLRNWNMEIDVADASPERLPVDLVEAEYRECVPCAELSCDTMSEAMGRLSTVNASGCLDNSVVIGDFEFTLKKSDGGYKMHYRPTAAVAATPAAPAQPEYVRERKKMAFLTDAAGIEAEFATGNFYDIVSDDGTYLTVVGATGRKRQLLNKRFITLQVFMTPPEEVARGKNQDA